MLHFITVSLKYVRLEQKISPELIRVYSYFGLNRCIHLT